MTKVKSKTDYNALDNFQSPNIDFSPNTSELPQQVDSFKRIRICDLLNADFNVRIDSLNVDDDFLNSIKNQGIRQPLTVIKDPKNYGKYIVLHGNRRLKALLSIYGKDSDFSVPCIVNPNNSLNTDNLIKLLISMAHENIQREDLSHKDQYYLIEKLQEYSIISNGKTFTSDELSSMLCIHPSEIRKIVSYSKLDDEEKKYTDNNLSKTASYEFSLADTDTKQEIIKDNITSSNDIRKLKKNKSANQSHNKSTHKKSIHSFKHKDFEITINIVSKLSIKECLNLAIKNTDLFKTI